MPDLDGTNGELCKNLCVSGAGNVARDYATFRLSCPIDCSDVGSSNIESICFENQHGPQRRSFKQDSGCQFPECNFSLRKDGIASCPSKAPGKMAEVAWRYAQRHPSLARKVAFAGGSCREYPITLLNQSLSCLWFMVVAVWLPSHPAARAHS